MKKPLPADFGLTEQDVEYCIVREKETESFSNKLGQRISCLCVVIVFCIVMAAEFEFSRDENLLFEIFSFALGSILFLLIYGIAAFLLSGLIIALPICNWYERKQVTPNILATRNYLESGKQYEAWLIKTQEDYWLSLSGAGFEIALAEVYQNNGYQVTLTSSTGDRGVDLFVKDASGAEAIVQCKAHRKPVGVGAARDLFGALHDHGATQAILASVSGFTRPTYEFAQGKPIRLLGLNEIISMARKSGT
jgi:hypothetical protein